MHPNDPNIGQTGPFWVGSGESPACPWMMSNWLTCALTALAIVSAIITFFFIRPLSHDGMAEEDRKFREYLEQHGYDTSQMGLVDATSETSSADYDEKKDAVTTA